MDEAESANIAKEVKRIYGKIRQYSEKAQVDSFLSYYNNAPTFLHFGSDGNKRDYKAFKKNCLEYYKTLKEQKVITVHEKIHVIETNLALVGWRGNIIARFKNGGTLKMNNYAITSVFKKIDGNWKIIHTHESSLPPKIIKK